MKPAFLLAAVATALLGITALAANGTAPATTANDAAIQRQGAGTPQNEPAATNAPACNGGGCGRGYCGGRGMGGGGMGMSRGPMMGRGMRQGPQDGTGPRRDGSCMGS